MLKDIHITTELRTGSNWQVEPTFNIWRKMSCFKGVSQDKLAKMGRTIDLDDGKSARDLSLGDQLLCEAWSDIVGGLIPDQTYSVADLESQFRLQIAFTLVIYGCLAEKLGNDEECAARIRR